MMNRIQPYPSVSKTCRLALVALIVSALTASVAPGRKVRRSGMPKLNNDQLGESLKRFRSLHRDATCVMRPTGGFDDKTFKTNWLRWVDCSLAKGDTFEGQELLAEANSARPFGILGSFYKKKLVELSYTLSTTSIDALLQILDRKYRQATRITYDRAGHVDFVEWADRVASLDVEFAPIFPAIAKGNFLRIGEGQPSNAVRIRTRLNNMPSSDP
jgi:hypothetical protein